MSSLADQAVAFAQELQDTLGRVLPIPGRLMAVHLEDTGRFQVTPEGEEAAERRIDLRVAGTVVGRLGFTFDLDLDRTAKWLKVVESKIHIRSAVNNAPLVRLEYDHDLEQARIAHWRFHAESGVFTHWLSQAHAAGRRVPKPFDLSKLHLPVGGERYRPCIEDVLQFLIHDCGIDRLDQTWREALADGRQNWRRRQFASTFAIPPAKRCGCFVTSLATKLWHRTTRYQTDRMFFVAGNRLDA
jgi:hypothetical protein